MPSNATDIKLLESTQRRATKIGKGSEGQGVLGVAEIPLFVWPREEEAERRLHGDLMMSYSQLTISAL